MNGPLCKSIEKLFNSTSKRFKYQDMYQGVSRRLLISPHLFFIGLNFQVSSDRINQVLKYAKRSTMIDRPGNRATLGKLRTYFYHCRIVRLIPVILQPQNNNWQQSYYILQLQKQVRKGPKDPYLHSLMSQLYSRFTKSLHRGGVILEEFVVLLLLLAEE